MTYERLLGWIILSAIIGFIAYCMSCAAHVWKSRNSVASTSANLSGLAARVAPWSALIGGLGVLTIVLAVVARVLVTPVGRLEGEGLVTVRVPPGLAVDQVLVGKTVRAGDSIVRFRSPEYRAEIASLRLRIDELTTEKSLVAAQPLQLDPSLVRLQQKYDADQRHVQASLGYLLPELDGLQRERYRDTIIRREEICTLDRQIEESRNGIIQTVAEAKLCAWQLTVTKALAASGAVTDEEHAKQRAEADVLAAEKKKREASLAHLRRRKAETIEDYSKLDAIATRQWTDLSEEVSLLREGLDEVRAAGSSLDERLAADTGRSSSMKRDLLQQIDLQIQQCGEKLAGFEESLEVRTPISGAVVYRSPIPKSIPEKAPILVIAPRDGIHLRMRVRRSEITSLARADNVSLELAEPEVERHFQATVAGHRELENDPGYVLANLVCEPPSSSVRALVLGQNVRARLRWIPPPTSIPFVPLGLTLVGMGGVSWIGCRFRGRQAPLGATSSRLAVNRDQIEGEATGQKDRPADAAMASMESGAAGEMIFSQGIQLADAILRDDVADELLSAIEWSLDRHHARAVRLLARGFKSDTESHEELRRVIQRLTEKNDGAEKWTIAGRLLRILTTIAAELVCPPSPVRESTLPPTSFSSSTVRRNGNGHADRRRDGGSNRDRPSPRI